MFFHVSYLAPEMKRDGIVGRTNRQALKSVSFRWNPFLFLHQDSFFLCLTVLFLNILVEPFVFMVLEKKKKKKTDLSSVVVSKCEI